MKQIAIIGVGNLLMGDEGVGIHAIKHLRQFEWPENVELIDAGVPGAALLHILEKYDLNIIIDCADFGKEPGEILEVDVRHLKKPDEDVISLHGTSLLGTISLAEQLNIKTGKIILICVQPQTIEMTGELSDTVQSSLPKIMKAVRAHLLFTYPLP